MFGTKTILLLIFFFLTANLVAGFHIEARPIALLTTTSVSSSAQLQVNTSHSSSLSWRDALVVMRGGRIFDSQTRTWSWRSSLSGISRDNFLLSWEGKRRLAHANQLLPSNEVVSKQT